MPEDGLFLRNATNTKWIPANRLQLFARISQYWHCDHVSRNIIDMRLSWIRNNQSYISGISEEENDNQESDREVNLD